MNKPTLVASAVSMVLAMSTLQVAKAQEADSAQNQVQAEETVERIEVTGSRIRRTDMEGVAPVTVITAEDLANSGYTSIEDLLQASVGKRRSHD